MGLARFREAVGLAPAAFLIGLLNARLARSLGVEVTRLRVKSFHPVQAILEVISEQGAGLFVFGPDRRKIRRLQYWRAARAMARRSRQIHAVRCPQVARWHRLA